MFDEAARSLMARIRIGMGRVACPGRASSSRTRLSMRLKAIAPRKENALAFRVREVLERFGSSRVKCFQVDKMSIAF